MSSKRLAMTSKLTGRARQLLLPLTQDSQRSHLSRLPTHNVAALPSQWIPHSYQKKAVKWLVEHAPGAGLFLDLSLGKTSISLEAFRALKKAGGATKALVIAPRRAVYRVWSLEGEIGKWAQFAGLRVARLHGDEKDEALDDDADIYVLSFGGLPWLTKANGWKTLLKRGVDTLIIDELSKLKHKRTQRFRLLKPWLPKFRRRWGLTGSPASRSLLDLFGQVYTLDLGKRLGRYITHYRNRWFYPTGFGGYQWAPTPTAEKEITAQLRDLVLAMRAQDHLDLPELLENNVWVDLPPEARKAYDEFEEDLIAQFEGGLVKATNAAVAAAKCCQVASGQVYREVMGPGPAAMTNDGISVQSGHREVIHVHDAKVEALLDLVDEMQGQPLLILYDFQHDLSRLLAKDALGPKTPVIGGGTSDKEADRIIDAWNRGELSILLGHPGSIGHALNLQGAGCGHVCFYTLPWDRELYDQTIGRVRRQGARVNRVIVHRILTRDTVDEPKAKSLAAKDRTQRAVFDALSSWCTTKKPCGTKKFPTTRGTTMNIRPGTLPPCTPAQRRAQAQAALVMDHQGRTAILLESSKDEVKFIPMAPGGCYVTYSTPSVFRMRFPVSNRDPQSIAKHPELKNSTIESAARCYVSHALYAGASDEAVAALEALVPITKKEKERIEAMKKAAAEAKTKMTAKRAEKSDGEKSTKTKTKPVKGEDKVKRVSAAATFRELIMQGKLTDDQIFAEVQKRHPDVGPEKRSYVAWYRNDLSKKGENPPAAKKEMKKAS